MGSKYDKRATCEGNVSKLNLNETFQINTIVQMMQYFKLSFDKKKKNPSIKPGKGIGKKPFCWCLVQIGVIPPGFSRMCFYLCIIYCDMKHVMLFLFCNVMLYEFQHQHNFIKNYGKVFVLCMKFNCTKRK